MHEVLQASASAAVLHARAWRATCWRDGGCCRADGCKASPRSLVAPGATANRPRPCLLPRAGHAGAAGLGAHGGHALCAGALRQRQRAGGVVRHVERGHRCARCGQGPAARPGHRLGWVAGRGATVQAAGLGAGVGGQALLRRMLSRRRLAGAWPMHAPGRPAAPPPLARRAAPLPRSQCCSTRRPRAASASSPSTMASSATWTLGRRRCGACIVRCWGWDAGSRV